MIVTLNYGLFPSDEFYTFSKSAFAIADYNKEKITALTPYLTKLGFNVEQFQKALNRETKSPFTKLVADDDAKLDASFMGYRTYLEACVFNAKEGWSAAAQKLLEIIRRHGWSAASFGYKAEIAAVSNIVSETRTKHLALLTTVNAIDWFEPVEANLKVLELSFAQSITDAPKGAPTVREVRPALTTSLKDLFGFISFLNKGTTTEELTALETALNELIVRSLATVKAAATRAENQKKAEGEEKSKLE